MIYENFYSQENKIKQGVERFVKENFDDLTKLAGIKIFEVQIRVAYLDHEEQLRYKTVISFDIDSEEELPYLFKEFYDKCENKNVNLLGLKKVFLYLSGNASPTQENFHKLLNYYYIS
jgi:hypothetical protein